MPSWLRTFTCQRLPSLLDFRPHGLQLQRSIQVQQHLPGRIQIVSTQQRPFSWWSGPESTMSNLEQQQEPDYAFNPNIPPPRPPPARIHILGTGNIGCLVAHSLRGISPKPPVTLLIHRRSIAERFDAVGGVISVERHQLSTSRRGFELEIANMAIENLLPYSKTPPSSSSSDAQMAPMIEHLIVTTKSYQALTALTPLKNRIDANTTIAFIQNGIGVIDELNETLFPDPATRPKYIVGITTHGVSSPKEPYQPFSVILNGIGHVKLGVVDSSSLIPNTFTGGPSSPPPSTLTTPPLTSLPPTTHYLLKTLLSCPDLAATHVSHTEILSLQLEKLAINAIINPLTVIFDCLNGELLHNYHATRVMKLLLWEISQVILSLPEIRDMPNANLRFSSENLYNSVIRISRATRENTSSMLQDVRKGRQTEVDYINGWVVRKGMELNVPCTMNYMITSMVKAREKIVSKERARELPLEGLDT